MSAKKTPGPTDEKRKRGRPRRVGPKPPQGPRKRPVKGRKLPPTKRGARFPRWWKPYLDELEANGGFKDLAKATIGINRKTVTRWLEKHPHQKEMFRAAEEAAIDLATDKILAEAKRRGVDGYEEPVFYQGKRTESVRRFSDTLLMFSANARGKGTRAPVQLNVDLSKLTDDQLRRIAEGEDPVVVMAGGAE